MDPNPGAKIRVLIIDDSLIVRGILRTSLASHPRIEVVGMAVDGEDGLSKIQSLRPDVVTLDVEMPKVNGIQVLERVGGKLPVAFVMCSTLTKAGASVTLEALSKGAFDYVSANPANGGFAGNAEFRTELHTKVSAAAASRGRAHDSPHKHREILRSTASAEQGARLGRRHRNQLRAADAAPVSSGVSERLCADCHHAAHAGGIYRVFRALLERDRVDACEAGGGWRSPSERNDSGCRPGSHHLKLVRAGIDLKVRLDDGPKVSGHRPSADAMFASLALSGAGRVVGVVMTGMGHDGAEGIRALSSSGAWTLAQDEASCLVYGMPKAAAATGVLDEVVSLGPATGRISHHPTRYAPASVNAGRSNRPSFLTSAGLNGAGN